ncbi:MAG: hypothetical protein IPO09_18790 [Anaeromyxobacter sp.]|nr:hypothetical protein [Anaeromyxobacter sp.]
MTPRTLLLKGTLLAGLVGFALPAIVWQVPWYQDQVAVGGEGLVALRKSAATIPLPARVVLGDSVANQLYPVRQDGGEFYSLACNQAISMAGFYALLWRLAEANDLRGSAVHLVLRPDSFGNDLDQTFTFQYFVKPFYVTMGPAFFDPEVEARVSAIPYGWSAWLPAVRVSAWSPSARSPAGERMELRLSRVSALYLARMRVLARERGFSLQVVPPVLPESTRAWLLGPLWAGVRDAGLEDLFAGYVRRLRYLPDAQFQDGVHVKDPGALGSNPLDL